MMSDRVGCLSELTCRQNEAGAIWCNQFCHWFDSSVVVARTKKKHANMSSAAASLKKKTIEYHLKVN